MALFGSFGNAIAWWYMFLKRTEKRTHRKESYIKGLVLLSSLLVADTIVCCICLPMQAIRMFSFELILNCKFEVVAFHLNFLTVWASSLSICVIAFERFVVVTRFNQYSNIITFNRIKIILTTCWIISGVGPGAKLIPGGGSKIFPPMNACMLALPLLILPFFYFKIVKTVKDSEKKLLQSDATGCSRHHNLEQHTNNKTSFQKKLYSKKARKVSRKCTLLISNFFFCSITCFSLMIIVIINTRKNFMGMYTVDLITRFAFTGLTMNSCMNPVIYVMRDSKFKAFLKKSFLGRRQNRVTPIQENPFVLAGKTVNLQHVET